MIEDQESNAAEMVGDVARTMTNVLMPFPTSLVLSVEQEESLCSHAKSRLDAVAEEMGGREASDQAWAAFQRVGMDAPNPENIKASAKTWIGKRMKYELMSANEVEYRAYLEGGIFAKSNLTLPLSRRIWRQMTARANAYFFSTQPWFAAEPVGILDRAKADKANRYAQWKTDRSKLANNAHSAVDRAFAIGECVVKTTFSKKEKYYRTWATVLTNEQGNEILTSDGDVILEEDVWIPLIGKNDIGEPFDTGKFILRKDPSIVRPSALVWEEKNIWRKKTEYVGAESSPIHFRDFICPLSAPSIEDSEFCAHLYDKPLMELVDMYRKKDSQGTKPEDSMEATREAIAQVIDIASQSTGENRGRNYDPTITHDPAHNATQSEGSIVKIAEVYLRYDADGDGLLEDIMLVMDRETGTPLFYDYIQNVTSDGKRPFTCIRALEMPGRWYGMGTFEIFEKAQEFSDLTINRMNHSVSKEGRVDFWRPENTVEGRANPHLEMNWGGSYTPLPGKTAKDCLESVYLQDNKMEGLRAVMDLQTQLAMAESGVSNTNDNNLAGLDSTKLATGIRNIEMSGQEIFGSYIHHLEGGITDLTRKEIGVTFANLDEQEVYRYFEQNEEGGEGAGTVMEIDPSDITDMELDVTILLSRYKGEQTIANAQAVIDTINNFYGQAPEVQAITAPAYQDILKALHVKDYDRRIVPISIPLQPSPSPNVQAAPQQPKQSTPNV